MSTKSFFYASAGIFLLVAAYTLDAQHSAADFDPSLTGLVVGGAGNGFYFDRQGQVWILYPPGSWRRRPEADLPVQVSEIKFFTGNGLITTSDIGWLWDTQTNEWRSVGVFPGGAVALHRKTWSGVKEGYRK